MKRRPFPRFVTVRHAGPCGWLAIVHLGTFQIRLSAGSRWLAIEAACDALEQLADADRREWGLR